MSEVDPQQYFKDLYGDLAPGWHFLPSSIGTLLVSITEDGQWIRQGRITDTGFIPSSEDIPTV